MYPIFHDFEFVGFPAVDDLEVVEILIHLLRHMPALHHGLFDVADLRLLNAQHCGQFFYLVAQTLVLFLNYRDIIL